jgi:hypothetical protein
MATQHHNQWLSLNGASASALTVPNPVVDAELPVERPALEEIRRVVTIVRELRSAVTDDGKTKLKSPSSTLSTAEAISVVTAGMAISAFYGDGQLCAGDIISSLLGAIVKDPVQDQLIWQE